MKGSKEKSNIKEKNKSLTHGKCVSCKKVKLYTSISGFYLSNNELHNSNNGRFPHCKVCLKDVIDINDIKTVHDILMQMNRPFLFEVWNSSIREAEKTKKDLFGIYYKNLLLNHKTLTWRDSIFQSELNDNSESLVNSISEDVMKKIKIDITKDMILRWGSNYQPEDYIKLENFYREMKDTNKIETPQEEAYVKKLAVISLKMDKELEEGNYAQAKQLGDLFSKYMGDGKFRAMDRTEADKTGGIRTFGSIYTEVEKDGHIPPWEHYRKIKGLTQDIIDQTILHIENFTLRLNKIERMTEPPSDTPKLTELDTDMLNGDVT